MRLMKTQYTIMVLGVIAAASLSIAAFGTNTTQYAVVGPQTADGFTVQGHLELIAADENGNIKQYVQTDNAIQEQGVNCIIQKLFFSTGGSTGTCAGDVGVFDTIAIGEDATPVADAVAVTYTDVQDAVEQFGAGNNGVAGTLTSFDTVTSDLNLAANATVTSVFNAAGTESVTEAILLNDTSDQTTSALAYRNFTAIALENNDSLTIAWTISVLEG